MTRRISNSQPILIVEDSEDDYDAAVRALKKYNLVNPLFHCEDGQEAIDFLFRQGDFTDAATSPRPGLVLLDINMPGVDGLEVLKKVKSDESLRRIPVVILTTSSDERDIADSYSLGANTYIQKPVDLDGLFAAIKRLKEYWFEIAILPKTES